jgi:hypothetical protein
MAIGYITSKKVLKMNDANWFNDIITKYSDSFTQQLYNLLNELYELGGNATTLLKDVLTNPRVNSSHIEEMIKKLGVLSKSVPASADYSRSLKTTLDDFTNSDSQLDILNKLILRSSNYSRRVALFIISAGRTVGWLAWGFSGEEAGSISRKKIEVNYSPNSIISRVRDTSQIFKGKPESNTDNSRMFQDLGGILPNEIACLPLITKGRVSGVLYLDQGGNTDPLPDLIELDIEVTIAGMMIDLVPVRKAYAKPSAVPVASAPGFQTTSPQLPFGAPPYQSPTPLPQFQQPQLPFQQATPSFSQPEAPVPSTKPWEAPTFTAPQSPTITHFEPARPDVKPILIPGPSIQQPAGPRTGTYGMNPQAVEPGIELRPPIGFDPLSEQTRFQPQNNVIQMPSSGIKLTAERENRQAHDEAKRFARLLILEIKLYNEDKVMEGRKNKNLYFLLKEEIDRSREVFGERIGKEFRDSTTYFEDELINILAGGDRSALGR